MSVYNRKMFKRNARNALNQSAGIAPVQKFQVGGPVQVGTVTPFMGRGPQVPLYKAGPRARRGTSIGGQAFIAPNRATNPGRAAELDLARRALEGGLGSLSAGEQAYLGSLTGQRTGGDLTKPLTDYLGDSALSSIVEGAGEIVGTIGGGLGGGITGLLSGDKPDQDTFGGRLASLTPDMDYLKDLGFIFPTQVYSKQPGPPRPPAQPRGIFQGPPKPPGQVDLSRPEDRARIEQERIARDAMRRDGILVSDEETGAVPPSIDTMESAVDNLFNQRQADEAAYQAAVDAADRDEAEVDLAQKASAAEKDGTAPETTVPIPVSKPDDWANIVAETKKKNGTVEDMPTVEPEPVSQDDVQDIVEAGSPETQEAALARLMKEFTQNAPEYDGLDKGLALAKIGFVMASGKSPRAIDNIANALDKGADMLIKDKSQRDAFKRQVSLSALQYGLGEIGKQRAEDRLLSRERRGTKSFTFGENGGTYRGRKYGPYEDVEVTVADIQDNKMPSGLVSSAMVTALGARAKANAAIAKAQFEAGQISMSELAKQQETYTTAVDNVIKSEQAVDLLEDVMVDVAQGNVTGFKAGALDFFNKVGNFAGFDFGKKYETKDQARSAMRQALQLMIPNTVGSTQSANSISNRDVDFLITAYFGEGAIDGGPFTFVTQDKDTMLRRLQGAALQMRNAQKKDFSQMQLVETNLMNVYQPGTQVSAIGSLSPARSRLSEAGLLPGQLNIGTTIGVTKGDDGVLRFN